MACIITLRCPCARKGRSISTGHFPVDASTVRLFSFVSGSRATIVRRVRCNRFPHIRSTSQRCLHSGSQSVDGRNRSAPSSTGSPVASRSSFAAHPLSLQKVRNIALLVLHLSLLPSSQCKLDVVRSSHGDQHQNSRDRVSKNAAHRTYTMWCASRFHSSIVHSVPCR